MICASARNIHTIARMIFYFESSEVNVIIVYRLIVKTE